MTRTRSHDPGWTRRRQHRAEVGAVWVPMALVMVGGAVGLSLLLALYSTIPAVFVGAAHVLDRL